MGYALNLGSFFQMDFDAQRVLQADGLEDGPELVIAVGPLVQDAQIEV
jgi:predicted short-subunit dehydrogenase-like oxidoreductase (DUF2520 family)